MISITEDQLTALENEGALVRRKSPKSAEDMQSVRIRALEKAILKMVKMQANVASQTALTTVKINKIEHAQQADKPQTIVMNRGEDGFLSSVTTDRYEFIFHRAKNRLLTSIEAIPHNWQ